MSQHNPGSAFDLLGKSVEVVKRNWQLFALINVFGIASALASLFDGNQTERGAGFGLDDYGFTAGRELGAVIGVGAVFVLLIILISIFLAAMHTSLQLKASKGLTPTLSELIDDGKKYWIRLFGLNIVVGVLIVLGLILLVVPGIFALMRLIYAQNILIDKDTSIAEAMSASNKLATDTPGPTWGLVGVYILISLVLGIVSLVPYVGALIATIAGIAVSAIIALRYLQVRGNNKPLSSPVASN